jgi:hypothetical protein
MIAKLVKLVGVFVVSANALLVSATPPNTTAANSVPYEVGQGWVTHFFDEVSQTRWFKYGEVGGHSYCIEAVQGSVSPIQLDPNLAVFSDATGATALSISGTPLTNNDGGNNPNFIKGSRICYIAPTTFGTQTIRTVKVNVPIVASSGDAGNIRLRIVDTTLVGTPSTFYFQPEYIAYGASVGINNHSAQPIVARLSIPFASNTHTQTVTVPAYGWGDAIPNIYHTSVPYLTGLTYLAHTGSPGTVKAMHYLSTTTYTYSYDAVNDVGVYTPNTKSNQYEMKTKN